MIGLARPGASIADPARPGGWIRPLAVGYVSAAAPVEFGAWTRWHAAVEAHAMRQRLPVLHVYSDDKASGTSGLSAMFAALRDRAHLRRGHIGVVIVPTIEHLSLARDGSEGVTGSLLSLHFGVSVQAADTWCAATSPRPGGDSRRVIDAPMFDPARSGHGDNGLAGRAPRAGAVDGRDPRRGSARVEDSPTSCSVPMPVATLPVGAGRPHTPAGPR